MRVDVEKYLFVGPWSGRDHFFRRAQECGYIEFLSRTPPSLEASFEIQTLMDALHVLRRMVPVKQTPIEDFRPAHVLARHIVERNHALEHLQEEERVLNKEISRIRAFGNFSLTELKTIQKATNRVVQFFVCKQEKKTEAREDPEVIYIDSQHGLDYYISIHSERRSYPGFTEMHIERSLGELLARKALVRRDIDAYETELSLLAHHKKLLEEGLVDTLNYHHLNRTQEYAEPVLEGGLFAVEGWIPKKKIPLLLKVAEEEKVHMEQIHIEKTERIPTYLENRGASRIGEDLVHIYDIPSASDRDPSLWVFIAFGLFFSMIVADAGYGLLLLAISLFLYFKYKKKRGAVKRVIKLAISLSVGCILWGTLTASFLGVNIGIDSPIRKYTFIDWVAERKADYYLTEKPASYEELVKEYPTLKEATTPQAFLRGAVKKEADGSPKYVVYENFTDHFMMELVIFVGTLHIMVSLLRYIDRNWAAVGWVVFMIGAYLYFPLLIKAISLIHYIFHIPYMEGALIGKYLVFGGVGLAWFLAIMQKKMGGLSEPMTAIQIFADVMSYLRIYALAVAGLILGETFNKIGLEIPYLGILIILAGHTLNFVLALGGGLIHGLRLNFIEWYHYSFEGGGKVFNPLKLIQKD